MLSTLRAQARPGIQAAAAARESGPFSLSVHQKIDVCRGVFAILVMAAHALDLAWTLDPTIRGTDASQFHWIRHTVGTGFYWVMGFFVLSGYCIHQSVARQLAAGQFPLRYYLWARATRILPLYYLALLATVAVERLISPDRPTCWQNGIDLRTFCYQLGLIQNFTQTFGSFASSWSITNEVFYYILYGLIAWIAVKRGGRPATIGMAISAIIGVGMMAAYRFGGYRTPFVLGTGLLFGLGVLWFLGAQIAAHREALVGSKLASNGCRAWPLLFAAGVAIRWDGRIPLEVVYLTMGVAFAMVLVRFGVAGRGKKDVDGPAWAEAPSRFLGLSSYPIYLFHGPIIMLVASVLVRLGASSSWPFTWGLMCLVSTVVGLALGVSVEWPIMDWRAGFLARRRQSVVGGGPKS